MRDAKRLGLKKCRHIAVVSFQGPLNFASTNYLEGEILNRVAELPDLKHLLIAGDGISEIDASGEQTLRHLVGNLRAAGYAYALERLSNGEPVIAMNDIALAPDEPDMVCRPAYPSNSQQRRAARHVIDDVVSEANAPSPRLRTYWFNRIRHLFT